jgi:hypothetical protein
MTRHEAEADILEIVSAGMPYARISTETDDDGNVPALNSALRAGLKSVGVTPASRTIADDDFEGLTETQNDQVVAVATLSILDLILIRWDRITVSDNGSTQNWGELYRNLKDRAAVLRSQVDATYGTGTDVISVGLMSLGAIEPDCRDDEF